MSEKILVLGASNLVGVHCVNWGDLRIPNLADYDVVFLNGVSLVTVAKLAEAQRSTPDYKEEWNTLHSRLGRAMDRCRERLREVLVTGGKVYAIVPKIEYFYFGRGGQRIPHHGEIDLQKLALPLQFNVEQEEGDTISTRDDAFDSYMRLVRRWSFSFSAPALEFIASDLAQDDKGLKVTGYYSPIAVNRQARPIACRFTFIAWHRDGSAPSSQLALLPEPTEATAEEGIRVLLQSLHDYAAPAPVPPWFSAIELPGEQDLAANAADAREELRRAQQRVDEAFCEMENATKPKRILIETGLPLQETVRQLFESIGIPTSPSPVSDEFMLVDRDPPVLVEVTGTARSVSGRDLSQLIKDLGNYLASFESNAKGLLVGNAWKDLSPDARDTNDRPIFPDNVRTTAANHSVALLSTTELLHGYARFVREELTAEQIINVIRSTSGVVSFAGDVP